MGVFPLYGSVSDVADIMVSRAELTGVCPARAFSEWNITQNDQ